jgi:hypothetical protein
MKTYCGKWVIFGCVFIFLPSLAVQADSLPNCQGGRISAYTNADGSGTHYACEMLSNISPLSRDTPAKPIPAGPSSVQEVGIAPPSEMQTGHVQRGTNSIPNSNVRNESKRKALSRNRYQTELPSGASFVGECGMSRHLTASLYREGDRWLVGQKLQSLTLYHSYSDQNSAATGLKRYGCKSEEANHLVSAAATLSPAGTVNSDMTSSNPNLRSAPQTGYFNPSSGNHVGSGSLQ